MLLVPTAGELDSLAYLVNQRAPEDLILRLFVTNITPAETDEAGDYVEASWVGYSAVALNAQDWTLVAGTPSTASYPKQTFTSNEAEQQAVNYGYFLTRATSGRIAWAERFSAPAPVVNLGDFISVIARISQGTRTARINARGVWVLNKQEDQIGVLADHKDGKAEFHRVGAEGLTETISMVDPAALELARWRDIPETRRPARDVAAKYGYQ